MFVVKKSRGTVTLALPQDSRTIGLVKTNFGRQGCPCHNTELHGTVPVGEWGGAETINSHGTLKA